MAKPRVFISSTFYDLRHVRADLEAFILGMGYEPVLYERGTISYGSNEKLEEYCYKELILCDMIVSIIGGRFGTESDHGPYSITQMELKRALEAKRQAYIFIEKDVLSEYHTYKANKDNEVLDRIKFGHVNDRRVFTFIEEMYSLPLNNQVHGFSAGEEISSILKAQWAGLFQRFLADGRRMEDISLTRELNDSLQTLGQLVEYLRAEKQGSEEKVESILLISHPVFPEIKKHLAIPYRVFFTNISELSDLLMVRGFGRVADGDSEDPDYFEWIHRKEKPGNLLQINKRLFDNEGRLKSINIDEWREDWVKISTWHPEEQSPY